MLDTYDQLLPHCYFRSTLRYIIVIKILLDETASVRILSHGYIIEHLAM